MVDERARRPATCPKTICGRAEKRCRCQKATPPPSTLPRRAATTRRPSIPGGSAGSRLRRGPNQEAEAIFLENCLGRRLVQKFEIAYRRGLRCRRRCHWVGDWGVRAGREYADDLHLWFDLGVGRIDDADRRLAARDEGERRAHMSGLRALGFYGGQGTERF